MLTVNDAGTLSSQAASLLKKLGWSSPITLKPLPGGANNRAYRIDGDGFHAFLKVYFRHTEDPRDRLRTEFSFCQLIWGSGIRAISQPLIADAENSIGIYEFIEGRPIPPGKVDASHVRQAIDFFLAINTNENRKAAKSFPKASEACFSIDQHLHCVERRLQLLEKMDPVTPLHQEAFEFVKGALRPSWIKLEKHLREDIQQLKWNAAEEISQEDRCLSPSDFGFHNAILTEKGDLKFIDLEYAGWDDPAKLAGDFFCQPKVPVPQDFFQEVVHAATRHVQDPEFHQKRIALLLPVYQMKWRCIMLNDFLRVGNDRRQFSGAEDWQERLKLQLSKARSVLEA